jgi:hypothetical protein
LVSYKRTNRYSITDLSGNQFAQKRALPLLWVNLPKMGE